jgi:N-acetyl-anhydromuramoyl-L-alanine amidase
MPPAAPNSFRIDAATGRVRDAVQILSPHFDARPAGQAPELIVVHGISLPPGDFGGPWIDRLFCGDLKASAHPYFAQVAALRVSAHVLIPRNGLLRQYVPFGARAWHAGVSEYRGRTACNDFSIGIELEGTDDFAYTDDQYTSLAALIRALVAAYDSLAADRVVGHSDIAPGRKTDPGPVFDWARLRAAIAPGASTRTGQG